MFYRECCDGRIIRAPLNKAGNIAGSRPGFNCQHILLSAHPMTGKSQSVRKVAVDQDQAGQRLDNWLASRLKGVPKSHVYRLLRTGQVRVNGGRAKPAYRVAGGDEVRIPPVRMASANPPPAPNQQMQDVLSRAILYESGGYLVLDKPAGLAVHGGSGINLGLIEALGAMRPNQPLNLAHRLDRQTSGCLILAKSAKALRAVHDLLRQGAVTKSYLALLKGRWQGGARLVEAALVPKRMGGERVMVAQADGRYARTRFAPLENYSGACLIEADLGTGRTHQIRVHAQHVGQPVAGDPKYGDPQFNRYIKQVGLRRLFLHAHRVAFDVPGGESVDVSSPLPDELRAVLTAIESGAS